MRRLRRRAAARLACCDSARRDTARRLSCFSALDVARLRVAEARRTFFLPCPTSRSRCAERRVDSLTRPGAGASSGTPARRALESRFKQLLGRTPRQEILRVQLNRIKELLVGTELPVWEIADRTGFDPEYLSVVFKQETGVAPSEYRRSYGLGR